ncbi:hypothetical protein [Phaeovulum sp. W22_SRMD_FR3]|uniref:hypothetical protein n=1 Tax=Phaeovulum sp. W22_SRMD_FR3 TaxID=3240274 RepID=UPI003F953EA6
MLNDQITHCLTIGRRPDLLQQTLLSLRSLPPLATIAINDFGDSETNAVFTELCPTGQLITPQERLGHHRAVDRLYQSVQTPFIFHNEDDWQFSRCDFLDDAMTLLAADPLISCVCVRDTNDMPLTDAARADIRTCETKGIRYQRLDGVHDQWYGYSFNPHLARKQLWEDFGGFSGFEKERHISRKLRATGGFVAYLLPPACAHIGDGRSAFSKPAGPFKRFKNWLRGR